jgi:hypothetical protein
MSDNCSENSCSFDNKDNNRNTNDIELKNHWENVYQSKPNEKLGWYEVDLSPSLKLIKKSGIDKDTKILNIGAGNTTLIDELLRLSYSNIIATDISETALNKLAKRLNSNSVEYIVDDLTHPTLLNNIEKIDLWIDRAVLHFLTDDKDQNTYFNLLKNKVKIGGYVILAQFNLNGAEKCSGLPVKRYDKNILAKKLGNNFKLIESFDYIYTMPSGDKRPYVYTLFKRLT